MTSEVEKKEEVKVEAPEPQQPEIKAQDKQEPQKTPEETPEQINWRRFREERAKERKQKEESDRVAAEERAKAAAFKAALEAITNKPTKPEPVYQEEFQDEESEDLKIEKKVSKILQEREAKIEEERRKREIEELPKMLVQAHNDFNNICTQENVDYLEYHYPEVAAAYRYMPDGFEKWSSLYKAVKRFVPNTDGKKEAKKAEKNLAKPQSASQSGLFLGQGTVPASSVRLSEEQKAANWQRMQREMNKI